MRKKFCLSIVILALPVFAQIPHLPEREISLPTLPPRTHFQNSFPSVDESKRSPLLVGKLGTVSFPASEVDKLSKELDRQFANVLSYLKPAPACQDENAPLYVLALQVKGELQSCGDYARRCAQEGQLLSPQVLITGGLCQSMRYKVSEAYDLFQLATDSQWHSSPDIDEAVFQFASFAMYGVYENQVDEILSRHPRWTESERFHWKSVLLRMGNLGLSGIKKSEVDQFLLSKIKVTEGRFQALLKAIKIRIAYLDYDYQESLGDLAQQGPALENPLLWYDLLYSNLYYGLDRRFREARQAYDVLDRYAHRWMNFPVENNTYNYTEIYQSACRDQLLQGEEFQEFSQFKEKFRNQQLSFARAAQEAQKYQKRFPDKADVLTAWGGFLSMMGRHDEAFEAYWKAHQLCRYYHRANWGLTLVKRHHRYSSFPDYDENIKNLEEEVSHYELPGGHEEYFWNWKSVTEEMQRRVLYGGRIWLPFVPALNGGGFGAYLKYSFDLLSESVNMSSLRDQRIGGANYPHDNRLWDDVRGVGGSFVVADLMEVYNTVQGDYNLLAHEMAHQVQRLMEIKSPRNLKCLEDLYQKAKASQNFPDGYSSYNKEEHFAQGVNYYLIPSDAPKRYGLNRSWLQEHNPEQLSFIQSLDESRGDWNRVQCPI